MTPRKRDVEDELRCAMCNLVFETEEKWKDHTLECAKSKRVKKFKCDDCTYATNKSCDMKRHVSRMHPQKVDDSRIVVEEVEEVSEEKVDNEGLSDDRANTDTEWERQDPGTMSNIFGEISDSDKEEETKKVSQKEPSVMATLRPPLTTDPEIEVGRVVRKPTMPSPVATSIKRKFSLSPKKVQRAKKMFTTANKPKATSTPTEPYGTIQFGVLNPQRMVSPRQMFEQQNIDKAVQTDRVHYRHLKRTTKTYMEGGCNIVIVEEEEDTID